MINLTKLYIIGFLLFCSAICNSANVTGVVTNATIANCNGGSIDLSVNGGVMPYTYFWKGSVNGFSATTQDIQNLAAGQYCVTVTDAICGTAVTCYNIIQAETGKLVFVSSIKNVTNCNGEYLGSDGSITLSTIGTPNCTYKWTGPNGFSSTSQNLSNLAMGTYNLKVIYPNGCVQTEKVVLCCCKPSNPTGGSVSTNYCMGGITSEPLAFGVQTLVKPLTLTSTNGFINVHATGGLFGGFNNYYTWSGPNGFKSYSKELNNLVPGTYCVTITDGCSTISNCFELQPCTAMSVGGTTTVACPDFPVGTVKPTVINGFAPYTYIWSNGETTNQLKGLTTGNYCVTITDFGGCTSSKCFDVGTAIPTIVNKTKPCQTCFVCGDLALEKCDDKPLITSYFNCNSYRAVCSVTNEPVDDIIGYTPVAPNPINCTIPCLDGTTILGTAITTPEVKITDTSCVSGATCTYMNVNFNQKFYSFLATNGSGAVLPELKVATVTIKDPTCIDPENIKICHLQYQCITSIEPYTFIILSTGTECVKCETPFNGYSNDRINNEYVEISNQDQVLNVFPNPFQDGVQIDLFSSLNQDCEVKVINVFGQIIAYNSYFLKKGTNEIRLNPIQSEDLGLYFLEINFGGKYYSKKLIKI
jgi:hypothetical protein